MSRCIAVILLLLRLMCNHQINGFVPPTRKFAFVSHDSRIRQPSSHPTQVLFAQQTEEEMEEEARVKILQARRKNIRQTLKAAESLKTTRQKWADDDDRTEDKKSSDNKLAVTLTAVVVAVGAVALRVGGRAALVSVAGLDFLTESPELREQLQMVLDTSDSMGMAPKLLAFTAGWVAIKVLCFDAGGVVLALASGILFGGVLQGALISAAAATLGSSIGFGLAKADTPVRAKALELLEEYPSLRGIEKVVARDGLKAVLTLRLAPVLPIPIGMYNYVYGVTNVPLADFVGGIFLGSLKPYLLDSYLGYFGKELIEQSSSGAETATAAGMQDFLLLGALGVSVLIGVLASQLASETWDSVLQEIEEEKKVDDGNLNPEEDGVIRDVFGWKLPQWIVGFQLQMQAANQRIEGLVVEEYNAKVWNYTDTTIPAHLDPAELEMSPEKQGIGKGIDLGAATCDGLVLSPILFGALLKYSDPDFTDESSEQTPPYGTEPEEEGVAVLELRNGESLDEMLDWCRQSEESLQQVIQETSQQLRELDQDRSNS